METDWKQIKEVLELCEELRKLGIMKKQYDIFSPFEDRGFIKISEKWSSEK
jgi:hypothetical protein